MPPCNTTAPAVACVACLAQRASRACCTPRQCSEPQLPSPGRRRLQLLTAIGCHIGSNADLLLLHRLLCSVQLHYRSALAAGSSQILIVDNDSAEPYATELRRFAAAANAAVAVCSPSHYDFGALEVAVRLALRAGAAHLAYFQHSMRLLRPLPLEALQCPLVAFQSFPARNFNSDLGTNAQAHSNLKSWVTREALTIGVPAGLVGVASHIFNSAFVADAGALRLLHDARVFETSTCAKVLEQGAERLLGVVAHGVLGSPPENCSFDGSFMARPLHVEKTSHIRWPPHIRPYPSLNVTLPGPGQCAGHSRRRR